MTDRARDILAAELRGSTAEFLGWLTGLKPPSDRESIPPEMRPAFDKMLGRICAAAEAFAAHGWQPIETAPKDGRLALVFRPLAHMSGDEPVTVKRLIGGNNHCWDSTVPKGQKRCNPTDGACHVTHWMPIPEPPKDTQDRRA